MILILGFIVLRATAHHAIRPQPPNKNFTHALLLKKILFEPNIGKEIADNDGTNGTHYTPVRTLSISGLKSRVMKLPFFNLK